jgi:hypothetical protein
MRISGQLFLTELVEELVASCTVRNGISIWYFDWNWSERKGRWNYKKILIKLENRIHTDKRTEVKL